MPITMMFAGDFAGVPYGDYCRNHQLLVEAQIKTATTFGFDFVSCISDPAREASDCGAKITWFDNQPPAFVESDALLADKRRLTTLALPDPLAGGRMIDRVQAAALFKERCAGELLIEGWIEGPCAEAADLRGINALMTDFFDDPGFVRDLFETALQLGLSFAKAQLAAGVDIIGIGDAAASLVGPAIYDEFVWPYEKRLVDGIKQAGGRTRMHICGNTRKILPGMGRLGCDIVDLDFMVPLAEARAQMGDQVLLGNMNPVAMLRNGTPEAVRSTLLECYRAAGPRYIVGAGCEVVRDTPRENLLAFCKPLLPGEVR